LILSSSCTVFCRDIVFCFYFFFLIAAFAWHIAGIDWTSGGPGCNPRGWPGHTVRLGIAFPVVVVFWSCAWAMFLCVHTCLETCLDPCGGISCCFGKRPLPRNRADTPGYDSSSESDEYASAMVKGTSRQEDRRRFLSRSGCCVL
jgi:hypothetical protein